MVAKYLTHVTNVRYTKDLIRSLDRYDKDMHRYDMILEDPCKI